VRLDLGDLVRRAQAAAAHGPLLVETAGGLLVPITPSETNADLGQRLGLPVLLVARTALGTINHTALTLAELARRHLPLAGLILVRTTADRAPHEAANADLIAALTQVRPLGTMPNLEPQDAGDPDRLADALSRAIGPDNIANLLGFMR
jgi:dethiobiotin synthetase